MQQTEFSRSVGVFMAVSGKSTAISTRRQVKARLPSEPPCMLAVSDMVVICGMMDVALHRRCRSEPLSADSDDGHVRRNQLANLPTRGSRQVSKHRLQPKVVVGRKAVLPRSMFGGFELPLSAFFRLSSRQPFMLIATSVVVAEEEVVAVLLNR